jgi:hypothetical protein
VSQSKSRIGRGQVSRSTTKDLAYEKCSEDWKLGPLSFSTEKVGGKWCVSKKNLLLCLSLFYSSEDDALLCSLNLSSPDLP